MKTLAAVLLATAASAQATAPQANCSRLPHLEVDADGAPDSYRIDGKGLSYTCDGVFAVVHGVAQTQRNNPHGWQALCQRYWAEATSSRDYRNVKVVGFLMRDGKPVIQKDGDPFPRNAYVTTTTLTVPGTPSDAQRHYPDATQIPYVVISPAYAQRHHLSPGDLVALYRPSNQRIAFAVYGDCCSLGEASVRAHQDLGNEPVVVRAGTRRAKQNLAEPVWMEALVGTRPAPTTDWSKWRADIEAMGAAQFASQGGLASLKACIASHQ